LIQSLTHASSRFSVCTPERTVGPPPWLRAVSLGISILILPLASWLVWWVDTRSLIQSRGYLNVEYLLLFAVAVLYPGWKMACVLTAELLVALLEPIAHLYYFSPSDALFSLGYLRYIPDKRLFLYLVMVLAYAAACAGILQVGLGERRNDRATGLALILCLCGTSAGLYDIGQGRVRYLFPNMSHGDQDTRKLRISRAPVISLLVAMFPVRNLGTQRQSQIVPLPSAMAGAMAELPSGKTPNVVLVLSESWGESVDARILQAQMGPLLDPAVRQKYRVETGRVRFLGPTTGGETRELCGDSRGRMGTVDLPMDYDSCWPARMNRLGYRTEAVHGFTPTMFERRTWYSKMGFADSTFLPELQRDGLGMCGGAFPGICDAEVARWIGARLEKDPDKPKFIHWVTLNAHLPVLPPDGAESRQDCAAVGVENEVSLCGWFNRVLEVNRSVAQLATTSGLPPTAFVVVGDHAPPFFDPTIRRRFSQTNVPWVILVPKTIGVGP
jgi:hypothetical protein